jgi:hypothetical protein
MKIVELIVSLVESLVGVFAEVYGSAIRAKPRKSS